MKMLALIVVVANLALVVHLPGNEISNAATPIVVELFTSEGCANCPAADAWLQQLDSTQPIPGKQAIVLSEHVDYFNQKGWHDSYSDSLFTDRQNQYVRMLKLPTPYTPQVIVDGSRELRLSNPKQMSDILLNPAMAPTIPVNVGEISVERGSTGTLRAHIEIDGRFATRNADIYAAIALSNVESQVLHGENAGQRLNHVAVVRELRTIGTLVKGTNISLSFQTKLTSGMDPQNLRLIVFVQEPHVGKVLGAAMRKIVT